ncbi:universal stress protein [Aestuariirhabdus litorea]|uniref:Universal stress protein UspA n=1 Tax=Aestuariirhabdus litorea TaxID=2528527 RepID=A0A3P3VQ51_9GAMM|nr:universal stress protein [Aestuariirhabdus litorea]RRJ84911.1 universal stress protein UspA [Aestuariirhabdus litorea]RWW98137.1 universal stress protein UspA [Endozoicomonadaceae bacterium GTF-13]
MHNIKNILVVVDTRKATHTALKRGKLIAKVTGATLHLLACNKKPDANSQAALDTLVEQVRERGINAEGYEQWHDNVANTVLHLQQSQGCALVIKDAREENELSRAVFAPTDWQLLRRCPCPVLLVKNDRAWENGVILAAIDADASDQDHQILNEVIMSHSHDIAGLANAECHIGAAHPAPMLSSPDPVFQNIESLAKLYRDACTPYITQYKMAEKNLHIGEGPAQSFIPELAERISASLVVMGTVARTGISGAIIGNTAELILDSICCDVLTLKPVDIMEQLEEVVTQR